MRNRPLRIILLSLFVLAGLSSGVNAQWLSKKKTPIETSYSINDSLSTETIKYSAPAIDPHSKDVLKYNNVVKDSYESIPMDSQRTAGSPAVSRDLKYNNVVKDSYESIPMDSDQDKGDLKNNIRAIGAGGGKGQSPAPIGQAIGGNKFRANSPKGAAPLKGATGASSSQGLSKGFISSGEGNAGPDVCATAEPAGMSSDYQQCSRDCKTVCAVKTSVNGVPCFICEEGGDDTCKDIGLLDAPHEWCEPGGICHSDPMLYCTVPFDAVGPRRSKLKCTNCKKRPDMCWRHVQDGTTTLTNCKLGCWDGTCEYRGKYIEKEWDDTDEYIHCYECVTPPPPPSCEDLGWGFDWEANCLNSCAPPGTCKEFLITMGKKNPNVCQDCDTTVDDTDDDEEEEDNGGTRTRGGKGGKGGKGGGGGATKANPPGDINDPDTPYGSGEEGDKTKTKPKGPCEEVADALRNNEDYVENKTPDDIELDKENMKRFQASVAKLKKKAKAVEKNLKPRREKVKSLGQQLKTASAAAKKAEADFNGKQSLGPVTDKYERIMKEAKTKVSELWAEYSGQNDSLKRDTASFGKDIGDLKRQALKDLYRVDPQAKQSEEMGRLDQYYETRRDLAHMQERRKMSDEIFAKKAKELQKKIDKGGDEAEGYQEQLDNLNRGKEAYDKSLDGAERSAKQLINYLRKINGEDGVGPFDERGLYAGVGRAAQEINKQRHKIKKLRDTLAKAVKNNCPPKNSQKVVDELDKKLKELDAMIKAFEDRQKEIDRGYPLSNEEKKGIKANIERVAEGSKKMGGVKTMGDFYLEAQVDELARTFDPTDPSVGLKKGFWYAVGIVEGVGKAIKGLVELGIGVLDLTAESLEGLINSGEERLFGTDATEILQGIMSGVDGNMNLDGLEKLAQGIEKAISDYFKKLSRSKDLDKATARAGGQFAGEFVVGDFVLVKGVEGAAKLYSVVRGAKTLEKGGKLIKTPKPKTPKIDDIVNKADDLKGGGSTGGKLGGKVDDLAKAPVAATPKKPRGPPRKATEFKGETLPDKEGVKLKPLDDATAAKLEKENGFRSDHAKKMHAEAQKKGVYAVVRDGNPDSVKFFDDPNKMPKPMSAKAKTAKVGPPENRGLVVDPTHPQQKKYWNEALKEAKAVGDTKRVKWLQENRKKAVKTWLSYGDEMKGNGYSVNKKTGIVEYTDPVTGKHFDGVHGDYDLHGVYKPGEGAAGPQRVSFGSGQKFDSHGVDVEGGALRKQFNDAIDPDKKFFQHGGQDDWIPDPKKVPHKGPDPPVTVFGPDGGPPVRLETAEEMKKYYEGTMGVKWEY